MEKENSMKIQPMKKSTQDTQREIEKKRIGGRKASAIPGRRCKPFHYTKRWFRDPPAREHGTLIIREEDIILRESGIIIRQTECRREWPLEKTLETRLYPIHPFPARPCTHAHAYTERVATIVSHAITRSVFWREAKRCREIRNDSKKILF